MNRELLTRLKTRVLTLGDAYCDMDSWIQNDENRHPVLSGRVADRSMCGTTGCLAGHGIALQTGSLTLDHLTCRFTDGTGERFGLYDIPQRASAALGISSEWFYMDNWPGQYLDEYQVSPSRAMAHVIEDLLNGTLNPDTAFEDEDDWEADEDE